MDKPAGRDSGAGGGGGAAWVRPSTIARVATGGHAHVVQAVTHGGGRLGHPWQGRQGGAAPSASPADGHRAGGGWPAARQLRHRGALQVGRRDLLWRRVHRSRKVCWRVRVHNSPAGVWGGLPARVPPAGPQDGTAAVGQDGWPLPEPISAPISISLRISTGGWEIRISTRIATWRPLATAAALRLPRDCE